MVITKPVLNKYGDVRRNYGVVRTHVALKPRCLNPRCLETALLEPAVVVALRKWMFCHYRFPPLSDAYERSRRATAGKLLAILPRFFFVFKKNIDISKQMPKYTSKTSVISEKKNSLTI